MRRWILLLVIQVVVLNATYQNEDNIDQYDTDKGGNGRTVVRANFPDRLVDLCPEIEEHEHNSGVKMAGTVYFPVVDLLDCDTYVSAAVAEASRSILH